MKAIFFCTIILFFSCSVVDSYRAREFSFDDHDKQGRVILQVPKGFAEEKFVLGNAGGKEQYYYYDNGSLFYIAKNVTWETENQPMIKQTKELSINRRFIYKGI